MERNDFNSLAAYLQRIPGVKKGIGFGNYEDQKWWIKFQIDISSPLAWNIVQELGNVLNYLSSEDRLPTVFYPVSPPSYLNGGPGDFLSWIIENTEENFTPNHMKEWLESRLPSPVDDIREWNLAIE